MPIRGFRRPRGRLTLSFFCALAFVGLALALGFPVPAQAEDGYDLWLRYRSGSGASVPSQLVGVSSASSPTLLAAQAELTHGLNGLAGTTVPVTAEVSRDGAVVFGTPRSSPAIASLHLDLKSTGTEGYRIIAVTLAGHGATAVAANDDVGVLHGAFHLLRLLQTHQPLTTIDLTAAPKIQHRILDHWDNLDGSVERGYAGSSIWDWFTLPDYHDPRYVDYARACASIGINGTVLTNVNANALVLTEPYLKKVEALGALLRPYGIKVYLSARFSAPIELGGLKSADPLDPSVRAWWQAKVEEIYRRIPDFGGFLVKANSEGQPGPQDYGRTHADGANMLADALARHGGIVMWRAFVYSQDQPDDRAKQAYSEFKPLDGKFRDNVLLQVKNGAIDFQPREPFHPLFGAMPRTPLMLEVQLTKEYLGLNTNIAYLGTMWEEVLGSDTFAQGKGSTVRGVIDGSLQGYRQTGIAGVANIGADRDWTGSTFDQANWYAFGRLAWDPGLSAESIAEEWARMTFSNDPALVKPVVAMMMGSRETVVDYMTPLGLAGLMAHGHHYGPQPWDVSGNRDDWKAVYYHRADPKGVGFDRTSTGTDAVAQYAPPVAAQFESLEETPEKFLLWFHRVPWDKRLRSGRTLWDELVIHYTHGVQNVAEMRKTWASLEPYVDPERFAQATAFLAIQERDAKWWRDASIAYFQTFSKRPLPAGYAPPEHSLTYYEDICHPYVPGDPEHHRTCQPPPPSLEALPLVHPLFRDHAVLETGQPVKIWGWTAPAQRVTVSLTASAGGAPAAGTAAPPAVRSAAPTTATDNAPAASSAAPATPTTVAATADGTGRWTALLPPLPPGGPYDLHVESQAGDSVSIHDVLIGYVWLCSGQSNMELPVRRSLDAQSEISGASNDSIRMLTLADRTSLTPLPIVVSPVEWQPTTAATVGDFSAACYYFARELQKNVHAPMGLINSSWGGSAIQTWMSDKALSAVGGNDALLDILRAYQTDAASGIAKWGQLFETWWGAHRPPNSSAAPWAPTVPSATTGLAAPKASQALAKANPTPGSHWRKAPEGLGYWENWGVPELASFDGLVWYRTTFHLTAAQAAQSGKLSIGTVDEVDQTWLNGRFIGTTSGPGVHRNYSIPAGLLHAGDNTIVIAALDTYGFGGIYGPASERAVHLAGGETIALNGDWHYEIAPHSVGRVPRAPWESVAGMTMIHNAMIAPLAPYTLRGVLWYQGESNTDEPQRYQGLLSGLMRDWREEFQTPLPFLIVQLAAYGAAATAPGPSGWAGVREAERLAVAQDQNAGLAVTVDIGDRYDIHPANKQELGRRLARAARHAVFHESITPSGPVPTSVHREGTKVVVTFGDVDGKLVSLGSDHPVGFELCGQDQASCRYADASIGQNRVILTQSGAAPTRVRLCWANSPVCTLFDSSGLPAGPFEMRIE